MLMEDGVMVILPPLDILLEIGSDLIQVMDLVQDQDQPQDLPQDQAHQDQDVVLGTDTAEITPIGAMNLQQIAKELAMDNGKIIKLSYILN